MNWVYFGKNEFFRVIHNEIGIFDINKPRNVLTDRIVIPIEIERLVVDLAQ